MPKIKKPRDPVMELINGRMESAGVSNAQMGEMVGITPQCVAKKRKQPSSKWRYGEIQQWCRLLGITSEDLRKAVSI